ncbi:MAG: hypothetical protein ACI9LM_000853 [Alteromonadaceae bacterium]|jgi:hypothetical protein
MINLFKALFIKVPKENTIAASIKITEMPAGTWWS